MSSAHDSSVAEAVKPADPARPLAQDARRLHRMLIDAVIATGSVPPVLEAANRLDMPEDAIRSRLAVLAAADYLALDARGEVSCLYPFSATPTSHTVFIDGQRRAAMCAIDALGVPAMLERELGIEGRCAVCDMPVALRVRPGAIVAATPPTTTVVARRDEAEPAVAACCPFTVFACGPEHADQFVRWITGARVLSLTEALAHAEEIFAGLLADDLPAGRPRGQRWGTLRDG